MSACAQVLAWKYPEHVVFGIAHEHRCHLETAHPVSEHSGVQVHRCGRCTLAWESDPRPLCRCGPNQTNPACPTHGVRSDVKRAVNPSTS